MRAMGISRELSGHQRTAQEPRRHSPARKTPNKGRTATRSKRAIPRVINLAWGVGSAPLRPSKGLIIILSQITGKSCDEFTTILVAAAGRIARRHFRKGRNLNESS